MTYDKPVITHISKYIREMGSLMEVLWKEIKQDRQKNAIS